MMYAEAVVEKAIGAIAVLIDVIAHVIAVVEDVHGPAQTPAIATGAIESARNVEDVAARAVPKAAPTVAKVL